MSQPTSPEQLKQRRHQLRQQRRYQTARSLWRFFCMCGILTGSIWTICQLDWTISTPEQVRIEGNQFLSDTTVRAMLAISYPQSLIKLGSEQLTSRLVDRGSIVNAKVDRGMFPPHLIVQIQDFPPVAQIVREAASQDRIYIDERGLELPITSYRQNVAQSLPSLQLRLSAQGSCPQWIQLYRAVRSSPVAIGIIDCRDPQNLSLQTEVGKVRIGAIGDRSRLTNQIQQLDRLRDWQKHTLDREVEALDLENPDLPKLQLKQPVAAPPKPEVK